MALKVLLTGRPGSGKSTLLQRFLAQYEAPKAGFLTKEILRGEERRGFKIVCDDHDEYNLALVTGESKHRVGRYAVYPDVLDRVVQKVCVFGWQHLLYLDEIGEMQLFSERFQELVRHYFAAENPLVATVSEVFDHPLIRELKDQRDVTIIRVTPETREDAYTDLVRLVREPALAAR